MFRRGVIVMVVSAILFAVMSAQVRGLTDVGSYTTMSVRFVLGALAVGALRFGGLARISWTNVPWLVVRGVTGGAAVALFFWAIQTIGLARATMFCYTSAIFATVFAGPILGERVTARQWIAVAAATVGMALLVGVQRFTVSAADLLALTSGVLSGIAVVSVAKCRETESSSSIFLSQCLFGIVIVGWPTYQHWIWPTPMQWVSLAGVGLLATAAQLAMTYAYKYTGASTGSLLGLLTPVMSSAIGIAYFDEHPGSGFYIGSALVLLACGYLSLDPVRRREPAAKRPVTQPMAASDALS